MKIDVNQLAAHFAHIPFQVEGIYRYARNPGVPHADYTDSLPGFVFPLTGKTQFQFNGKPYIFSPGKVVHGGPKMKLAHKMFGNTDWEYILVLYRICSSELEESSFSHQHFELLTGQSPRLIELIMRLWHVYNQRGGISMFQTEMLFRDVLNEALLCVDNRQNSYESHILFERVSNYIHEYYDQSLTIASLAEQNNVNRNRLSYVFRRHAGMGPAEYLLKYRINMAQEMLFASDAPVQQIAQTVGIADPFYFSRVFKKQLGISPTQYREKFINNPCQFQQASILI
ncbi:AraC family transcriptional regulator [Paenibacillus sp. ACRRX]|uniref:helix-turn-helix transcriptional regulator n=1 Tax=Paenibacillus sp. ACRRX TaxID=2918206 RepID=UPI001EF3DCCA|nr:AraC family transcriptional regulator [Paenibacillus sp. ACRRX]